MIWILAYVLAAIIACVLAQPAISFLLLLFTFGLIYLPMLGIGLAALLGPLAVLILIILAWLGRVSRQNVWITAHVWACALIVHAGASYGQSHWGDVGGTMGAKNMPYIESFLSPFIFFANRLGWT